MSRKKFLNNQSLQDYSLEKQTEKTKLKSSKKVLFSLSHAKVKLQKKQMLKYFQMLQENEILNGL